MAIDPEVLKRINDANPFGQGRIPTDEERHHMKGQIAALRAENHTFQKIASRGQQLGIGTGHGQRDTPYQKPASGQDAISYLKAYP